MVLEAQGLDDHTRHKAEFYVKQIANAVSPSNFVLTNPELLRLTLESNGENLVKGMQHLVEDLKTGEGELKIRQTDPSKFKLGENLGTTPGKVIAQNDVCQIIQYSPTTEEVLKRPLLIVPPWINKFYILDLNPEKSFIKWAVDQGHTVFVISWVNPDQQQAQKSFEHYMKEGILHALDVIKRATRQEAVNAVGYCVGGTLLAVTRRAPATSGSRPPPSSPRRSTSPSRAISRSSSMKSRSPSWKSGWRNSATWTVRRCLRRSTCSGPTT
jgi:polyhydroxyalkanoate synthase